MKHLNNESFLLNPSISGANTNGHRRRRATNNIGLSAGANNDLDLRDNGNYNSFVGGGSGLAIG